MSKNNDNFNKRLKIWSEKLYSPAGVTYKEICKCFIKELGRKPEGGDELDQYGDVARQDMKKIKDMLAITYEEIEEFGNPKHFRLTSFVDLAEKHRLSIVEKPYAELISFLSHADGIIPKDFLTELSYAFKDISNKIDQNDINVDFEYNHEAIGMRHFPIIYKSIRKSVLEITRHRPQTPDIKFKVLLHPEFLKEYKSAWYVFGNIQDLDLPNSEPTLGRIPLSCIDRIKMVNKIKFIETGMKGENYIDILSEVIGVEIDEHCKLETIEIRISNKLFQRVIDNPIHETQKLRKDLDKNGYKGFSFVVRRNKELIRTILSLGKDVEVVSPSILRKQIKKELDSTLSKYN